MQESSASVSRSFFWPLWARIAFVCFMLAVSALTMWDEFYRFDWVGFLCMGLSSLIYVPMQKGEELRAYRRKPRTMVSVALVVGVGASALHALYRRFTY